MKRLLILLGLLVLFGIAADIGYNRTAPNPDPNHNHADFAVWISPDTKLDFAQEKYMTEELTAEQLAALEAQTGTGKDLTVLKQYLHLHDMNGDVVHRHKPGLGFGDFLKSIGFSLTDSCLTTDTGTQYCNQSDPSEHWRLFVNGKEILPFQPNYIFTDDDQILLVYGADAQPGLSEMTDEACQYSKTCPGRGAPPTESCIADPTVPCKAP